MAVLIALQNTDPATPLTIIMDSRYAMDGLTLHLLSWEDKSWIGTTNSKWFQAAAYHLRRRSAEMAFKWVKGHAGSLGNEQADALANAGAHKPTPDEIDTIVPPNFNLNGAKLATLTQALAHEAILDKRLPPYKRSTLMNLDIARHAIHTITQTMETDKSIWEKVRNVEIRQLIQNFLYRALHHSLRIGDYWDNIPTYKHRVRCSLCQDQTETLEHILLKCNSPGRSALWQLAADC